MNNVASDGLSVVVNVIAYECLHFLAMLVGSVAGSECCCF
jgi:hypothetical protein